MAASNDARSALSPFTTSAPACRSACAAGLVGSRTNIRTDQPLFNNWRAVAPPCRPVAPNTNMVFLKAVIISPWFEYCVPFKTAQEIGQMCSQYYHLAKLYAVG